MARIQVFLGILAAVIVATIVGCGGTTTGTERHVDVAAGGADASAHGPSPRECEMDESTRAAFETRDAQTDAALRPILLQHRDMMKHLELPLSL